ncbi:MAG: aspartate/glutamate racemase family protein [Polaromonas sp.]|nr:aspartate/glutamate racemase family protein [Polaromonas sp.]
MPTEFVSERKLLGMLTPSSNTILEPVTAAMLAGMRDVSAHFGRFRVTEIALSADALAQFGNGDILAAAELLSHARCQVIGWNGTSSGWLGFESDVRLCAAITRETGAHACTSVLALNEILRSTGVKRLGLVTPFRDDVQHAIMRNYARLGIACTAERHAGLKDNFSFSQVTDDEIRAMVRAVMTEGPADQRPEAVTIFCTNLRGAPLAAELEAEFGVPVYDTIATVVWKALRLAEVDTTRLSAWGSLFSGRL